MCPLTPLELIEIMEGGGINPARGLSLWISYSLPSIVVSVFPQSGTVLPLLATLLYLALSWSRVACKRKFRDMRASHFA